MTAAANEQTPLLAGAGQTPTKATPLPWASVLALCFCRLVEPIAFTVIFPFVNQMIQDTGVDPAKVGYRAGLIEGLFTFSQFLTILQWGRLSDRIGRKPVIIFGMAGASVSVLAFGLSKTFIMMVIARACAGLLNGNVGVIKSSLGEMTDHTNEAAGFILLPVAWTAGASIGPILGGYLSNPVKRYPSLFRDSSFLREYKYFLPCAVGAAFPLLGILSASLFMKETLVQKKVSNEGEGETVKEELPDIKSVLTKRVCLTLTNYAMLAFTSISGAGVIPLFMYTPVRLGGIGFTESQIGKAMSAQAITTATCQILLFAPVQKRLGTIGTFRVAAVFYPIAFALFPLTSNFARIEQEAGAEVYTKTWISLSVQLFCLALANIAYSCNMLLINASAPSARSLGTLNGISQMTSSAVRTIGLAVAPALFAFSIQHQVLGGNAIWIYMVALGGGLCCTSWLVTDAKASWRDDPDA